jgi:DNA primase
MLDIIKYNIGYCETGPYKNRIILPSYDTDGNLNYFTARDFYNRSNKKYLNPSYNKEHSIIYENLINWNMPVVLCEGMFDAISIKINAIPLLGKFITPKLKMMLIKYSPDIYIALDNDAYIDTINSAMDLINEGLNIYILHLDKNQDPDSMGFKQMQELMKNPKKYTETDLLTEYIQINV